MHASLLAALFTCSAACSSDDDRDPSQGIGGSGPIFGEGDGPDFGESGSAGTSGDLGPGGACVGQTAGTESNPAVLELVVDTSGSMEDRAPGSRSSKWAVTRRALLDAFELMPAETSVGVVFYPDVPISEAPRCFDEQADVSIARLEGDRSEQRQRLERAFMGQAPDGGTPTHDAYRHGVAELSESTASGRRFVVLITDGTPTFSLGCEGTGFVSDPVDPSPLVTEAARVSASGVSTFVIGSPGSEGARESLSRMAEAGGTASPGCSHDGPNYCHFDMTERADFGVALTEALGTISGLALSCDYAIPEPPGGAVLDPDRVNVLFSPRGGDAELIPKAQDGGCADGWQYSQDGTRVVLCESTCERVRDSNGSLSLQFGCATQVH